MDAVGLFPVDCFWCGAARGETRGSGRGALNAGQAAWLLGGEWLMDFGLEDILGKYFGKLAADVELLQLRSLVGTLGRRFAEE